MAGYVLFFRVLVHIISNLAPGVLARVTCGIDSLHSQCVKDPRANEHGQRSTKTCHGACDGLLGGKPHFRRFESKGPSDCAVG